MKSNENILPFDRAAALDLMARRRNTQQSSRDGSMRGLACEVLGSERAARHWMARVEALEAPLLNKLLVQRVRSARPVDFMEAAVAVWA